MHMHAQAYISVYIIKYTPAHTYTYSSGLAIWSCFPYCKNNVWIAGPISNSSELLVKWIYGKHFGAIHKKMLSESR